MEKIRGFEIAKGFEDKGINLPVRKTKYSAGYDVEAAENTIIPSFKKGMKPTLVKTGIKAYMKENEYLMLANRSSNPGKKGLILANSIGVVDQDYYGNSDNDGHIMFAFYNIKDEDVEIKKGDCMGQAIFMPFLIADNDMAEGARTGGFGSTNKWNYKWKKLKKMVKALTFAIFCSIIKMVEIISETWLKTKI